MFLVRTAIRRPRTTSIIWGFSMRHLFALGVAALFAFAPLANSAEEKTTAETAMANKAFSTLVAAVKAAGLAEALNAKGPITVFAPTNAAFEKLGKDKIEA